MAEIIDLDSAREYWSQTFQSQSFSGAVLLEKEFDGCVFSKCDFEEATFKRCNFVDCEFVECNLNLVKMEYCKFSDVVFRESRILGVNWTKVAWPSLMFSAPVKFYKSLLSDCSFCGLDLQELVLEDCKAHDVDFRDGNFSNANFSYTELDGSLFSNTNLTGADFTEATGYDIDIQFNQIKNAKFSRFEAVRLLQAMDIELVD